MNLLVLADYRGAAAQEDDTCTDDWAAELREFRRRRDWSQQDVAEFLRCAVRSVCSWEQGSTVPSRRYRGLLRELFANRDRARRGA